MSNNVIRDSDFLVACPSIYETDKLFDKFNEIFPRESGTNNRQVKVNRENKIAYCQKIDSHFIFFFDDFTTMNEVIDKLDGIGVDYMIKGYDLIKILESYDSPPTADEIFRVLKMHSYDKFMYDHRLKKIINPNRDMYDFANMKFD